MEADAGLICLVDMEEEEHSAVCHRGFSDQMVSRIRQAKLEDDVVASQVVRTGRHLVIDRVFDNPRVAEKAKQEGIRPAISVPLKSEGEVNGILVISTRGDRRYSDEDGTLLQGIGSHLGMAISNSVLYEQSQLQSQELGAMLAVGKAVTSSLDLGEVLDQSLDTVIEITSDDAAEVWLTDDGGGVSIRRHRGGHREAFLERSRFRIGEGVPGIVAESREPLFIHDVPSDDRFLRQAVTREGFHTFCALPLVYQNKLLGVLTVAALSEKAMKASWEVRILEGIGEWLSLAVENARLYEQVQDLAVLQKRERIAREMHDGMAQLLGYVNTQTIAVRRYLFDGQVKTAREELSKLEDVARDLYGDVREGILGLRVGAREQGGLVPSLREYVAHYKEMSDIEVQMDVPSDLEQPMLHPSVEIQLLRIVQEALSNIRKHAQATEAAVRFHSTNGVLHVAVSDNGNGFDPDRPSSTGWPRFGLQTMRERAEAVGGALIIDSTLGEGSAWKYEYRF